MTQCCVKDNTRPWCSYSCFVTCSHFLPVFSSLPHDVAKFLFLASISHVSTCHIVTMYHPVYFHITCLSLQPGLLKTVGHIGRRGGDIYSVEKYLKMCCCCFFFLSKLKHHYVEIDTLCNLAPPTVCKTTVVITNPRSVTICLTQFRC